MVVVCHSLDCRVHILRCPEAFLEARDLLTHLVSCSDRHQVAFIVLAVVHSHVVVACLRLGAAFGQETACLVLNALELGFQDALANRSVCRLALLSLLVEVKLHLRLRPLARNVLRKTDQNRLCQPLIGRLTTHHQLSRGTYL